MSKKSSKWLSMFIQFVIGGIVGFIIGKTLFSKNNISLPEILIWVVVFVIAFILQLIIHEGGHLLFGLLTGYSFLSFRIFNLMWLKKDNHIVLKRFSLAGTGGQCLLAPPDYNKGDYSIVLYNLGGSLLNIIISILCFIFYFLFQNIPFLSPLFLVLGIIGIYLALMNGIPLQVEGMNNDGFNALYAKQDPLTKKAFWITLKINELNTQNIRLKDMDESLFPTLQDDKIANNLTTSLLITNFQRFIDQHDFKKAQTIIEYINDNHIPIMGIHQNILINDQIFYLLVEQKFDQIDLLYTKQFKQFIKAMKKTPSIIRSQYAYELLYNKNEIQAQKYLNLFNQVMKTYPYQCDIESEKELMDYAYHVYTQENNENS